jgi:hypothetical protein
MSKPLIILIIIILVFLAGFGIYTVTQNSSSLPSQESRSVSDSTVTTPMSQEDEYQLEEEAENTIPQDN